MSIASSGACWYLATSFLTELFFQSLCKEDLQAFRAVIFGLLRSKKGCNTGGANSLRLSATLGRILFESELYEKQAISSGLDNSVLERGSEVSISEMKVGPARFKYLLSAFLVCCFFVNIAESGIIFEPTHLSGLNPSLFNRCISC
jgi:hypothetical protein